MSVLKSEIIETLQVMGERLESLTCRLESEINNPDLLEAQTFLEDIAYNIDRALEQMDG